MYDVGPTDSMNKVVRQGKSARQYGSAVETDPALMVHMGQGTHGQTGQEMKGMAHGLAL